MLYVCATLDSARTSQRGGSLTMCVWGEVDVWCWHCTIHTVIPQFIFLTAHCTHTTDLVSAL